MVYKQPHLLGGYEWDLRPIFRNFHLLYGPEKYINIFEIQNSQEM